ncbi:hypothetical protein SAMD00019534_009070 [Acytostelium subglobosum LB1]|uniref:hypothetical protein n=1 Tax=Acytostelium subglobosum LB1 TaxID=1410327 RepID=UPI000644DB20|nr:hypothetical protein SAMD00019534_009070 [Acytostelium subglobosum LB1]GAM17732.1 hypothetical protein SAMD00019534_009070 [Acytostelium subglobosum LB1]|eukprot:XP_012758328.1 hypothetical protein SAMD00019534_009070 [Acytostelium subglobosum LB1]
MGNTQSLSFDDYFNPRTSSGAASRGGADIDDEDDDDEHCSNVAHRHRRGTIDGTSSSSSNTSSLPLPYQHNPTIIRPLHSSSPTPSLGNSNNNSNNSSANGSPSSPNSRSTNARNTELESRKKLFSRRINEELGKGRPKLQSTNRHRQTPMTASGDGSDSDSSSLTQSDWSNNNSGGLSASSQQKKKWEMFVLKSRVLKELLATERDYVKYMHTILNIYFQPLKALALEAKEAERLAAANSATTSPTNTSPTPTSPDTVTPPPPLSDTGVTGNVNGNGGVDQTTGGGNIGLEAQQQQQASNESSFLNKSAVSMASPTPSLPTQPSKRELELQKEFSFIMETPLTLDEVKTVFSQIEVIHLYNSQLLAKFEQRLGGELNESIRIGDVFLDIIDFLKVPYSHYIINFPASLKILEAASKRPSFMLFIQQCKVNEAVANRNLQSFVSMPIQRIPRYVLLLRELLKYTQDTDADYANLCGALKKMETIADLINKQMREDEHSKVVIHISQTLRPSIDTLVQPHRRLIREGEGKIINADGNNHEAQYGTIRASPFPFARASIRYFYLFNDLFIVTKRMKDHYRVDKVISLEYSTIVDTYKKNLAQSTGAGGGAATPEAQCNTSINNMDGNEDGNNIPTSPTSGERHFFKLHTLDCAIVICLGSETEKNNWKNDFINVINHVTDNTLLFNPKWTKNNYIYNHKLKQQQPSSSPQHHGPPQSFKGILSMSAKTPPPTPPSPITSTTPPPPANNNTPNPEDNNTPYKQPRKLSNNSNNSGSGSGSVSSSIGSSFSSIINGMVNGRPGSGLSSTDSIDLSEDEEFKVPNVSTRSSSSSVSSSTSTSTGL